jgi:HD-like signal output (HDOD) protein
VITNIKTLPSQPALYHQLVTELQNNEPNMKRLAEIISKDIAMTAKVLQLANSAYFNITEKVTNPQRAITILGLNTTKSLALCSNVFSEFENRLNIPETICNLWDHSMVVSSLARKIAMDLQLSAQEVENAQV